jgi:hypothetical protein
MKSKKLRKKLKMYCEFPGLYCEAFGHIIQDGQCAICKIGLTACVEEDILHVDKTSPEA